MSNLAILIVCTFAQSGNLTIRDTIILDKSFMINNVKHTIHIENIKSFSEANDYIILENSKNQRITHALKCKNK